MSYLEGHRQRLRDQPDPVDAEKRIDRAEGNTLVAVDKGMGDGKALEERDWQPARNVLPSVRNNFTVWELSCRKPG